MIQKTSTVRLKPFLLFLARSSMDVMFERTAHHAGEVSGVCFDNQR